MSSPLVQCPKCRAWLLEARFNQPELSPCLTCGAPVQVEVFPALFRRLASSRGGESAIVEGESTCFYHPSRKAVLPCEGCGRFLCALCDCELNGRHFCPACLETGKTRPPAKPSSPLSRILPGVKRGGLSAQATSEDESYARIARSHVCWGSGLRILLKRSSLWTGEDHVLCLDSSRSTRRTRRFYYRDIQAFVLRRTRRRMWLNLVLSIPAVCAALLLVLGAPSSMPGSWDRGSFIGGIVLAGSTLVLLLMILVNTFRGPTCTCHIRTAVHFEPLLCLARLRKSRRALDQLRPSIVAAQGQLSPEEAYAKVQEAMASADDIEPRHSNARRAGEEEAEMPPDSYS